MNVWIVIRKGQIVRVSGILIWTVESLFAFYNTFRYSHLKLGFVVIKSVKKITFDNTINLKMINSNKF